MATDIKAWEIVNDKDPTQFGDSVTLTATVARMASSGSGVPTGTVQFTLDDSEVGAPIKPDSNSGNCHFKTFRFATTVLSG